MNMEDYYRRLSRFLVRIYRFSQRCFKHSPLIILFPCEDYPWCGVDLCKRITRNRKNRLIVDNEKNSDSLKTMIENNPCNLMDKRIIVVAHPYPFDAKVKTAISTNWKAPVFGNWFNINQQFSSAFFFVCEGAGVLGSMRYRTYIKRWISFENEIHFPGKAQSLPIGRLFDGLIRDLFHVYQFTEQVEVAYNGMKSTILEQLSSLPQTLDYKSGRVLAQIHLSALADGITIK